MKLHNTAIFMGDTTRSERHGNLQSAEKKGGNTIFAGDLNKNFDPIAQKKKQAQKQAMKIVSDAWAGDKKIDSDLDERRNKISQLTNEVGAANKEIKELEDRREELRQSFGVDADSQEQKDLELLEKEIDAQTPGKNVYLTAEEKTRIEELKAAGLTEYQQGALDLKKEASWYEERKASYLNEIETENKMIMSTKLERLKSDPMLKAQQEAEDIKEAASKEIVGMLIDEAKDHIDEEMEEKKKAAEEKAEKEKELEEKLEKTKEKKEEQEELTEDILESVEAITDLDGIQDDVQKEIKDMMIKMKLLEEDLKGAAVDTSA